MVRACMTALALLGFVTGAEAQVELTFKYPENSHYNTQTESKFNQTFTIAGMNVETVATSTEIVASAIGARGEDGTLRIDNRFETMQMQMELPGGLQYSFHSDNPDAQVSNEQLAPFQAIFRAVAATPWTTVLDEDDNIAAIEGKEKVVDAVGADTAVLIRDQFDREYLLDEANRELEVIPIDPLAPGDVWELDREQRLGAGQMLNLHRRYEYAGTLERDGRTLDRITSTATAATFSMDPNSASPLKVAQSKLTVAASEGEILFDRELGHIVETHEKLQVTGDMSFNINGMDLPGSMDLTLESTVKRLP